MATAPAQCGAGSQSYGHVYPPASSPDGLSYAQWGAAWWSWVLSIPFATNPMLDPTGANQSIGQSGPVWFLAGTTGGPLTRSVTIPSGRKIFFPLVNFIIDYPCPDPGFQPAPGQTLEQFLQAQGQYYMSNVTVLECQVDGLPVPNLANYRAQSGLFTFTGHPSLTATFDPCITGSPQPGVSDGFWVMLYPLSAGAHTLYFRGRIDIPSINFSFETATTYNITVSGSYPPAPQFGTVPGVTMYATASGAGQVVDIDYVCGGAGLDFFTCLSLEPLNAAAPGAGWWYGLWLGLDDLILQYTYPDPSLPFHGVLNAGGNAHYTSVVLPQATGAVLYGVTVVIDPLSGYLLGASPVFNATLL
jgi:hypothetical protein